MSRFAYISFSICFNNYHKCISNYVNSTKKFTYLKWPDCDSFWDYESLVGTPFLKNHCYSLLIHNTNLLFSIIVGWLDHCLQFVTTQHYTCFLATKYWLTLELVAYSCRLFLRMFYKILCFSSCKIWCTVKSTFIVLGPMSVTLQTCDPSK